MTSKVEMLLLLLGNVIIFLSWFKVQFNYNVCRDQEIWTLIECNIYCIIICISASECDWGEEVHEDVADHRPIIIIHIIITQFTETDNVYLIPKLRSTLLLFSIVLKTAIHIVGAAY